MLYQFFFFLNITAVFDTGLRIGYLLRIGTYLLEERSEITVVIYQIPDGDLGTQKDIFQLHILR